ncbi:hypothetical protein ACFX13_010170 [Malus domestica]
MTRGVSADQVTEWQDKYWEAADEFGHKELGSEKLGRDATGNAWHEFWTKSMWQRLARTVDPRNGGWFVGSKTMEENSNQRADLRWNRKLEDMEHLKSLQDELLDAASLCRLSAHYFALLKFQLQFAFCWT